MVKRLLVFLFVFGIGCSVLTCASMCKAQTETKKNSQPNASTNSGALKQDAPEQEKLTPQDGKKVAPKKDDPKTESKPITADSPADQKTTPEKSTDKPGESKTQTEKNKQDATKQDGDKSAAKKEMPAQDESQKAAPKTAAPAAKPDANEAAAKPATELAEDEQVKSDDAEQTTTLASEQLLPPATKLWVSIPNSKKLSEQIESTQFGQLAKDESIKPFIESFRKQVKDYLNGQNVQLGMDVDDLNEVQTGEICIAGVLRELDGKQPADTAHGLVLLVDVSKTNAEAVKLLDKVNALMVERGAKLEDLTIQEVPYKKTTINNPKRFRPNQSSFQTIVNGWMLVSDNELIFRDILRRLATPNKIKKTETLSVQPAFVEVMNRTDLGEVSPHVRWFVDPFGYLQLAQALEEQGRANRVAHDDLAGKLRNNGFDAFQGVGGNISIATDEHEVLHRTFIFAPNETKPQERHIFDLFDFSSDDKPALTPAKWVPADCSAYFVANWNMSRALDGFGVIYDGIFEKGEFERMLSDFRVDPDMQLDVRKLVGLMNNRVTIVSAVERPITETSERICIGIPITGEPKFVFDSLKRATRGQVISLGGIQVIKVDSSERDLENEEFTEFDLPGEEFDVQDEEEEERQFELFKQRFFVVRDGHLLVANNKDFLRELLAQKQSTLSQCPDYVQIKDALGKLTIDANVSFRQFGRIDQALETHYEMLRRGEMGKSQTVLARVVNQIFAKKAAEKAAAEGGKADPDEIREQKLDGSKLPADYAKSIAPYFGPTGWVMETEKGGWRITGCVLKKKEMTEVVQKLDDPEKSQR